MPPLSRPLRLTLAMIVALGLLVLGQSGCASAVQIPKAPAWVQVEGAATVTAAQVAAECHRLLPGVPVNFADGTYVTVSHAWLEAYVRWTASAAFAADVAYTPESFDCDKFALAFYLVATRKAAQAGIHAAPLIARLIVAQRATFATVPGSPTARHAIIGVATDRGLYVVEPQPTRGLRLAPLAAYPNRILSVTFGDYNPR